MEDVTFDDTMSNILQIKGVDINKFVNKMLITFWSRGVSGDSGIHQLSLQQNQKEKNVNGQHETIDGIVEEIELKEFAEGKGWIIFYHDKSYVNKLSTCKKT